VKAATVDKVNNIDITEVNILEFYIAVDIED
jgi:hypothetical protein